MCTTKLSQKARIGVVKFHVHTVSSNTMAITQACDWGPRVVITLV